MWRNHKSVTIYSLTYVGVFYFLSCLSDNRGVIVCLPVKVFRSSINLMCSFRNVNLTNRSCLQKSIRVINFERICPIPEYSYISFDHFKRRRFSSNTVNFFNPVTWIFSWTFAVYESYVSNCFKGSNGEQNKWDPAGKQTAQSLD